MSKVTKPPAQQGGPADGRAGTSLDDPAQVAEGGEGTALQQRLESVLEEALSEARAEIGRREEVEQKLERVRIAAANLAIELNQAERDLEEARKTVKPESAERIAKLDAALVQTRSELVREKATREQLQRDYDAAALQSGVQLKQLRADAEQARAEAARAQTVADEARAELKRAQEARVAHEKELADQRKAHEQELAATRQVLTREEAGHNRDREQLAALEQLLEAATKQKAEPQAAKPAAAAPPPVQPPVQPSQPLADKAISQPGRLKRRKRVFEARGRTCAVCRRTEAASPGALNAAGWALGAEIDLCPDCQAKGWQLPKAGSLPFRRSSLRREAG